MFLHKVYKIGRIGRMGLIGRIRTAQIKFRTVQILQYHFFVVPLQSKGCVCRQTTFQTYLLTAFIDALF